MGLFDKKNKASAGKNPEKKKGGFSRGVNNLEQTANSVEQGFGNQAFDKIESGIQAGFEPTVEEGVLEQTGKKVKKARKMRKPKLKKSGGGFLSLLKGKKKSQNQEQLQDKGLNTGLDSGFNIPMENISSNFGNQGMQDVQNGQFDNQFPNAPMHSIPVTNDSIHNNVNAGQMGMEQMGGNNPSFADYSTDSGFANSDLGLNIDLPEEEPTKKGLFGKKKVSNAKKTKKLKPSSSDKSSKTTGGEKGVGDSTLLKVFAAILVLLICVGVAALFLIGSGTGGTISSNAPPEVSVIDQPAVQAEPEQSPQDVDGSENTDEVITNTQASAKDNAQPESGLPTVVEADSGKTVQPVNTEQDPASIEPKTESKPVEQTDPAVQTEVVKEELKQAQPNVEEVKEEQPKDKVNKPITLKAGKPEKIVAPTTAPKNNKPVSDLSYAEFLNEASTTIYREE